MEKSLILNHNKQHDLITIFIKNNCNLYRNTQLLKVSLNITIKELKKKIMELLSSINEIDSDITEDQLILSKYFLTIYIIN